MIYQAQAKKINCWKMFGKKRKSKEQAQEDAYGMAKNTNATAVIVAYLEKGKINWYDTIKLTSMKGIKK